MRNIGIRVLMFGVVLASVSGCIQKTANDLKVIALPSDAPSMVDHSGYQSQNSCTFCHEKMRPQGIVSGLLNPDVKFDHTISGSKECSSCHEAGVSWIFTHNPEKTTSCMGCHESVRPSAIHNPEKDCGDCHLAGTFWADVKPFSHDPVPSNCTTCHEVRRPKGVVTSAAYPAITYDHTKSGTAECSNCHAAGVNWVYTHNPLPTNCSNCHEPLRPATHLMRGRGCTTQHNEHFNSYDCFICHKTPTETRPVFKFSHYAADGTNTMSAVSALKTPWGDNSYGYSQSCNFCHYVHSSTCVVDPSQLPPF